MRFLEVKIIQQQTSWSSDRAVLTLTVAVLLLPAGGWCVWRPGPACVTEP